MKKMVMDKRGQGNSIGMFVVIALGILALIFGYLFMSGFFTPITQGLEAFTPEQVDVKVLACEGFATLGATDSFCKFTELDNVKNTYINCELPSIKTQLEGKNTDLSQINCGDSVTATNKFCSSLSSSIVSKATLNGKICLGTSLEDAKKFCERVGEKRSYKEGTEWKEHPCVAGDISSG